MLPEKHDEMLTLSTRKEANDGKALRTKYQSLLFCTRGLQLLAFRRLGLEIPVSATTEETPANYCPLVFFAIILLWSPCFNLSYVRK